MIQFVYNNLFYLNIYISLFITVKDFTLYSETEIFYKSEIVHTLNYN